MMKASQLPLLDGSLYGDPDMSDEYVTLMPALKKSRKFFKESILEKYSDISSGRGLI